MSPSKTTKVRKKPAKNSVSSSKKKEKYLFINKTVFFPEPGILALGDLHLGYEKMLTDQGLMFPINQKKDYQEEIRETVEKIISKGYKLKKIIILGDLKHHFGYQVGEKFDIREFLKFLEGYLPTNEKGEKDLILLRGNHERFELDKRENKDNYIVPIGRDKKEKIAFIHGDKNFIKIWDKDVKTIVMGHLHPAISLSDSAGIKIEKYKTYLQGKYKNKNIIILPSYLSVNEGTEVNNTFTPIAEDGKEFSIIPEKELEKFNVYIHSEDKIYDFGKLKNLM